MKRAKNSPDATEVEATQDEPTQPRAVNAEGRTLDRYGLPLGGPARVRALDELGKPDPHDDPDTWADASSADTTTNPADAGQQD